MTPQDPKRFDLKEGQARMKAVVTTGHGGYEQLVYRDVPVPVPGPGEVLLQVLASSVNNTDINTRLGWYSAAVTTATQDAAAARDANAASATPDGGWGQATPFPFIQGTDCCGRVVAVAPGGDARLIGQRVLVRPSIRPAGFGSLDNLWMGSDFDGAFAQFVKVPASEVFAVHSDWSDAELATIPCAYGTAENMLHRANLRAGEQVVVAGASGGVGSAVVQLARRRGAIVTAIAGKSKMDHVKSLGADRVVARDDDLVACLGENTVDLVVDNVAGPAFGGMLKLLKPGGRYVSSGAIAGPLVTLDLRTLYLKNLTLLGCTAWDEPVFANLVAYIERGELRPLVAQSFALVQIAQAQRAFLEKTHVGKFVLIPPPAGQP
ncbi:alcohol dehydrogenase family protein [Polaromonas glacialis]|uniref:alcohol dehydrogenase family protein n=1 Tax=Polaromonas glacialis TaxID=866564 RepID=UPI0006907A0B|nr:alcohol dehydrogenase family protein [Polaromonas glacialis]